MEQIECKNPGPVEAVTIRIRPEGGVTELLGRNDCGKSTVLRGVDRLAGDKTAVVTCREGETEGSISGLGVEVLLRKSTRRIGELEAVTLDGKLTIGDLVDPGIKSPAAADDKRIKALLAITGAKADAAKFHSLLGGAEKFKAMIGIVAGEDLTGMAAEVKRRIEAAARKEEELAKDAKASSEAVRAMFANVDLKAESDAGKLDAAYREAVKTDEVLKAQAKTHEVDRKKAKAANAAMDVAKARYRGPTVEDAEAARDESRKLRGECENRVDKLEAELQLARSGLASVNASVDAKTAALRSAEQHRDLTAGWQESIDAMAGREPVDEADLVAAGELVTEAGEAQRVGAKVREAKVKLAESEADAAEASKHGQMADSLREAAKGTDDVLSAAVDSDVLRVVGGRLMTTHPTRGDVPFHERSPGFRCRAAIDEGLKRIQAEGAEATALLTIPQGLWEGLDPVNREAVESHARKRHVNIVTARCTDGPIRAVRFGEEEPK